MLSLRLCYLSQLNKCQQNQPNYNFLVKLLANLMSFNKHSLKNRVLSELKRIKVSETIHVAGSWVYFLIDSSAESDQTCHPVYLGRLTPFFSLPYYDIRDRDKFALMECELK